MRQYKKIVITLSLMLITLIFIQFLWYQDLNAQRNLYIGDLIHLRINDSSIAREDLTQQFEGFEIVDFVADESGIDLTLQCLEVGTKNIYIGKQEIEIIVESTLVDIQRDDIYEVTPDLMKPEIIVPWFSVFISTGILFLGLVIYLGVGLIKKKRQKELTLLEQSVQRINALDLEQKDCLGSMTLELKGYIQHKYSVKALGKTTEEFKSAIANIPISTATIQNILVWLNECDFYKFSGSQVNTEKKQLFKEKVLELLQLIDKEVTQ